MAQYVVDLDADPMVPDGWNVEEHTKGGQFEFDPKKVTLYLEEQQQAFGMIIGNELRKKLEGKKAFNANLLEFYLAHPSLIPEEWKGKSVFFWGTIYRHSGGYLFVRYLYWDRWRRWDDACWRWTDGDVDDVFGDLKQAVVPASN